MIKNYLVIATRNLQKNPLFAALNIFGLSLGLAVSILLFLHVRHELSFDSYHSKADRIHRVLLHAFWDPSKPEEVGTVPNVLGPASKDAIPAIEQYARLLKHEFGQSAFITAGNNKLIEEKLYWTDPGILDIFDIKTVAGDLKSAFTQPNTVALSRSAAIRYFGTSNPVGQIIKIDRMDPMEVRAVFEDFPTNSTLEANILGSFLSVKWANKNLVWSNSSFETWLLLNPDADYKQVEKQLGVLLDKNVLKENQQFSFWLQPLTDTYLHSSNISNNYSDRVGDPQQVTILGALALALMLIACFNYMNLSTARAQMRAKEVGISKTMGATRQQLALRFYVETGILTTISLVFALGLLVIGIPIFNNLADKQLSLYTLLDPQVLAAILGLGVVITLVAGSYPALSLSSFLPKDLLKTSFRKESGAGFLRRSLVTLQFMASVILITGTIVLYRQMQFVQQKKLGFEPEQVVALTTTAVENTDQMQALIQGCNQISSVSAVCRAQSYPGKTTSLRSLSKDGDTEGIKLYTNRTTPGFEKVMGMKLLAGTSLPDKLPSDTVVHVVINKMAADYLGFTPEDAIGKKIACDFENGSIVSGVVENFHNESLHKEITAYAYHDANTETRRFLLVKMNSGNIPESMKQIEQAFTTALPQSAFEYKFLNEKVDDLYKREKRTARIILIFSLFSVLISCLGLFGLAAYAAERRTKEIGVRRVLGASISGITALLAKDFLILVVLAIVLAAPITYYLMNTWLSNFAYRIDIQWWMFVLAGLLATMVAFLTVSTQSIKAALINPSKSLKSE
jgi:putative ABC transport system permease protein